MERKKGLQLNQAFGVILTLVLVAVLVIIAIVIFVSLQTSFAGTTAITTTGEALTASDAGTAVADATLCSFGDFAITTATNASGTLIPAANFSTTAEGLVSNLTIQAGTTASPWTLNYTGTFGSAACTASEDTVTEFATYTSLIGLLGTIIFLGLVIGILITAFAFGGRREV